MDEPWWEGRVASDVHCTLREKVSPSSLSGWGLTAPFAPDSASLGYSRANWELRAPFFAPRLASVSWRCCW